MISSFRDIVHFISVFYPTGQGLLLQSCNADLFCVVFLVKERSTFLGGEGGVYFFSPG